MLRPGRPATLRPLREARGDTSSRTGVFFPEPAEPEEAPVHARHAGAADGRAERDRQDRVAARAVHRLDFAAPTITGAVKDATGSCALPMPIVGGFMLLSGIIAFVIGRGAPQPAATPTPRTA